MLPHIHIAFFSIPMYSLMALVGLIAFTIVSIHLLEKKEGLAQRVTNRLLIICAAGFVILVAGAFAFNSLFHSIESGKISIGGVTWLGGVLCAFPLMIVLIHHFCPYVKGEALECFNLLIPGIALGHSFGRIGCFFGGCCYGARTDSFWGVSFPEGSAAAKLYPAPGGGSLPVLPTQLFEAAFELALFLIMLLTFKKMKRHFLEMYAIGYGTFRFFLEFLRGDDRGATGLALTPSQLMSVILILSGVLLILYHKGIIGKRLSKYIADLRQTQSIGQCSMKGSIARQLREMKSLADDGIISQEEFEAIKRSLISSVLDN